MLSRGVRQRVREPARPVAPAPTDAPGLTAPEMASAAAFGAWLALCDEAQESEVRDGHEEPNETEPDDFEPCDF